MVRICLELLKEPILDGLIGPGSKAMEDQGVMDVEDGV